MKKKKNQDQQGRVVLNERIPPHDRSTHDYRKRAQHDTTNKTRTAHKLDKSI
jgi:hypothetical protein